MSVLFSRPITLLGPHQLPRRFSFWGSERGLSFHYAQKYPRSISEYVLRCRYAGALLAQRARHDAIVTGRYGELFALVQGLLPFGKRPHLLLDVEWPNRHARWWRSALSRLLHHCIGRGAWKIQVFCEAEADSYSQYFGIDRDKFVWIPYCTDLSDADYPVSEKPYIFTGGLQNRDYATLAAAVRDLPMMVRVAAPAEQFRERTLPPNMRVLGRLSREDYFASLAGARLVVLSLEDNVMRCPGVITYVAAMRLGKCVIVNEPRGAQSYIDDGRTGIIVPPRDPQRLADAIRSLWEDDRRRRQVADQARTYAAEHFCLARYLADLERLIDELPRRSEEEVTCSTC